MRKYQVLQL